MDHNLFKPQSFKEGQEAVVGSCNGFSMEQRYEQETPLFAKAILRQVKVECPKILDYGCGVGRLAKEILKQNDMSRVDGTDASAEMMKLAEENINYEQFHTYRPQLLTKKYDLIYCVYVLQHAPAIEIREILQRIYDNLVPEGIFIYCSSDCRMAIRYDGGGFHDDRYLGVDLQQEVERYFEKVSPLFTPEELSGSDLLRKMVNGDATCFPHPAFVYKKRKLVGALYNATPELPIASGVTETLPVGKKEYTKLVLINRLAPGDILVMTNALRDLHKAYPGKYQTEVRSPCNAIFENNPYYSKLNYSEVEYQAGEAALHKGDRNGSSFVLGDVLCIDMHYPIIHSSGEVGSHFGYGHRQFLEDTLGVKIPQTSIRPEIYLNQTEKDWANPLILEHSTDIPYWCINAGSKGDYTLKQYPYYQEVVDLLKGRVQFVQVGMKSHNHVPLNGVIDMVGKTNDTRKLFKLIHGSLGVLTCVSFPMHIAAAFSKPCVVVAGGREGTRWELYPNQQFLYINGCIPCATYDGCWKNTIKDCLNVVDGTIAKCMKLITPSDIVRSVERYYDGGVLSWGGV